MTLLERAIESAQARLCHLTDWLTTSSGNDDTKAKKAKMVEVAEFTLKVLQEKAEREKGCDCCKGLKSLFYDSTYKHPNLMEVYIEIDGNLVVKPYECEYTLVEQIKIHNCPMCGRKLR